MAYHKRDVFFEIGDYVYNVAVSIELPCDNYDEYIDKIIQSIEAEPLDSKEVGVFMKNVPAATGTTKAKLGKATISLPNIYVNLSADDSSMGRSVSNGCIRMKNSDVEILYYLLPAMTPVEITD